MRRFVAKLALFLLLQTALFAALLHHYDPAQQSASFWPGVQKHRRLRATPPPRLILVGGSNLPFGIHSDVLERELGRPVVNMGWAAGLGAEFMMAEVESQLRPGDLVVLSLEYDHFARGGDDSGGGFDGAAIQQALIARPRGILNLQPMHFRKIILNRGLPLVGELSRRSLGITPRPTEAEASAARASFNEWGDLTSHRGQASRYAAAQLENIPLVAKQTGFPSAILLRRIQAFVQRCERRGVRGAYTFSPKPIGALQNHSAVAAKLRDALRAIPNLIVLDSPGDHAYPPEQFYDTANHLTTAGASARTAKLAAALRPVVARNPDSRSAP